MTCPNVNHPDWIKLVETVGEDRAWALYQANNYEIPTGNSTEEYFGNVDKSLKPKIKEGVEELFNSNPELANQVYEALGFKDTDISIPDYITTSRPYSDENIGLKGRTGNMVEFTSSNTDEEYRQNMGGYLIQTNDEGKLYITDIEKFSKDSTFKGLGTVAYVDFYENYKHKSQGLTTDKSLTTDGIKVLERLEKIGLVYKTDAVLIDDTQKHKLLGTTLYKYNKPLYEFNSNWSRNQIIPQQKQQALEVYSQYLDSIGVTDIAYHHSEEDISEFTSSSKRYFQNELKKKGRYIPKLDDIVFLVKKPLSEEFMSKRKFIGSWGLKTPRTLQFNAGEKVGEGVHPGIDEGVFAGIEGNYDAVDFGRIRDNKTWSEVIAITSPNNAIKLGSKQDIEGFKKFVEKETPSQTSQKKGTGMEARREYPINELEEIVHVDSVVGVVNRLKRLTGIKVIWNSELPNGVAGRFTAKGVELNPNYISKDAPWHEFLHAIIEVLHTENKELFDNFVKKLYNTRQGKVVLAKVRREYPHLNESSVEFQKEAVTTMLGYLAVTQDMETTMWQKFVDYVATLLNRVFGRTISIKDLSSNMSMQEFTRSLLVRGTRRIVTPYASNDLGLVLNHLRDQGIINDNNEIIDREQLDEALADINKIAPGALAISQDGKRIEYTSYNKVLEAKLNEKSFVKSVDNPDVYKSDDGKELSSVGKLMRGFSADPAVREMTDDQYKDHLATVQADAVFKNRDKTQKLEHTINGEYFTYEQLVAYRKKQNALNIARGRAHHYALEMLMAKVGLSEESLTEKEKENIKNKEKEGREKINKAFEAAGLTPDEALIQAEKVIRIAQRPYLKGDRLDLIALQKTFGFNPMLDTVTSEMVIASERLGIAGTTDLFVEHAENIYSINDFKSGVSFDDKTTSYVFLGSDIQVTPLQYAKLQVALYAFIVKSVNPEAKFRRLVVTVTNPETEKVEQVHVEMDQMLPVIQRRLTVLGYPKEILNDKVLMTPGGYSSSLYEDIINQGADLGSMSIEQLEAHFTKQLRSYSPDGELSGINFASLAPNKVEEVKQIFKQFMAAATNNNYNLDDARDMSYIYNKFGDLLNVKNERLKAFSSVFYRGYHRYWEEMQKLTSKHKSLLIDVLKEQGLSYYNLPTITKRNPLSILGFMWKQSGEVYRLIQEEDPEFSKQVNTASKKAYYDFYVSTIQKAYEESTSDRQKAMLDSKYLGLSQKKVITPYVPKDGEDRRTVNHLNSVLTRRDKPKNPGDWERDGFKELAFRLAGAKEDIDSGNHQQGVPINYLGYREDHTFDTELMFYKALENMLWKKHMDPVFGIGRLLSAVMADQVDIRGRSTQRNNLKFLEDKINMLILREKSYIGKWDIKIKDKTGKEKIIAWMPFDQFFDYIRRWGTLAIMPARPVLMIRNFLMEQHFNIIQALKGSIRKRRAEGTAKEFIDYTTGDFLKANAIMIQSMWDPELRKKKNAILKKYKLSIDFNYEFDTTDRILSSSIIKEKHLYFTSQVGEAYNAEVAAIAAMVHDGMWDKHNNNGDYIGPVRGYIEVAGRRIELKEYRHEELRRLREVVKRIHGSYSEDQKSNLEAYAFGRLMMQFQKYKINYLQRSFISTYNNDALGRFIKTGTTAEGETIFEWESQVDEGWVITLGRLMAIFSPRGLNALFNGKLKEELNLSEIQVQNMYEMGIVFASWMSVTMGVAFLFDPDDDDKNQRNILYANLMRLRQSMLSSFDLLGMAKESKTPAIGLALAAGLFNDMDLLFSMERYKQSSKRYGYKRGELKFAHQMKKRYLPLSSTYKEFQVIGGVLGMDVGYQYKFSDLEFDSDMNIQDAISEVPSWTLK
jgi:hypothetical protein